MITQQDDGWSGAKMTSFFSSLLNKLLPARRATSYAEAKENQVFVYGEKTKNLLTLYRKISGGCDLLSYKQLQAALFDLGIHLLPSQAFQLLHANKCLKSEGHVTFGEFCIMVDTIQEQHKGRDLRELQRQNSSKRQIRKKTSGLGHECQIFLGGSCNPTTWRKDEAVPYLEANKISYFNPQVCDWTPDLIEAEDKAKQDAMILFFVIDSKTRSITSVVEAAYLAGSGRQMVLVITGEPEEPAYSKSKMGRNSSIKEFEDLDYSRSILQYLADKQGVPVFSVVKDALDCANILTKWTQELVGPGRRMRHGCTFTDLGAIECSIRAIKQAFELCDKQNSGTLDFKGVTRAFKQVTKEVLSTDLVSAIIKNVSSKRFTLDEFCCLFTEFKHWRRKESLNEQNGLMKVFSPSRWFKQPCMAPRTFSCDASTMHYVPASVVDVYVAGSCGTNNWRNTIVLPLFREKGMTYLCSETLSERDTIEKNRCRLLLYVIEDNTMGTVDMMEIGYDIGQGYNLILSIENMAQDSVVQGISLSRGAVKDYNRSRMYLADLAAREGIPVFSSIEEAAKHAVEKVQFLREHPSPRPGLERARSCED